jgi:hypothetical protein
MRKRESLTTSYEKAPDQNDRYFSVNIDNLVQYSKLVQTLETQGLFNIGTAISVIKIRVSRFSRIEDNTEVLVCEGNSEKKL